VAAVKKQFTAADVRARAARTLEKCILHGTTLMRTHLEVDPGIGLRSLEGVLPLIEAYKWAMDIEICVFPQEGLLNNPGTDELMLEALKRGARVVGAASYTDTDPRGQIDRVFQMARTFDVDIDMHLDFGNTAENMDLEYVCEQTEQYHYGGRVAVGHVTKLSTLSTDRVRRIARRMADAGVALTVLPSTDLYLMGRHQDHNVLRGVVAARELLYDGVNCSLSTNNVLNPFTPFGDCSLLRMANLYANICQVGKRDDIRECFEMITARSARLMRRDDYGVEVGKTADLVVLDCQDRESAVAEVVTPLYGFKRGRPTFTRRAAELHRP
jgi:cytosine deaminase